MSNKEVARAFQLLASMMELHGENPFRVRSYRNAYNALKRTDRPLGEMSREDLSAIPGIGKSTAEKIRELVTTGQMQRLEEYKAQTPPGVREMLMIKGFGPKKVLAVWKELGVQSPGELLYACNENRLIEVAGFGLKTQSDLKKKISYYLDAQNKYLYAVIEPVAEACLRSLRDNFPKSRIEWVGEYARRCPVVNHLELLADEGIDMRRLAASDGDTWSLTDSGFRYQDRYEITLHIVHGDQFGNAHFHLTGSAAFVEAVKQRAGEGKVADAEEAFQRAGLPFVIPEMRENAQVLSGAIPAPDEIISEPDVRGILHNHSTYSDGLHSLRDMAVYVRDAGYGYLGISDHSKTAVYASGLSEEEVLEQHIEIDALNTELAPFRIYKGIESDILSDGSLDYSEEVLKTFEFIVASVHSNLKMDEKKATKRLIKAVENPYTDILGHPTGRLLLSRPGYPLDVRKVIDACAANDVAIELNANPQRLDLDYTWIPYAITKDVWVAINPDAHSKESIHNVRYGVLAARKGGLTKHRCLNCLPSSAFSDWLKGRKSR